MQPTALGVRWLSKRKVRQPVRPRWARYSKPGTTRRPLYTNLHRNLNGSKNTVLMGSPSEARGPHFLVSEAWNSIYNRCCQQVEARPSRWSVY